MSAFTAITAELFTPIAEALPELQRRRNDTDLQQKIRSYFAKHPCTKELAAEPGAVMAPTLASPNFELNYFLDTQKNLPLKKILYEFGNDKFVHLNFEKHCLGEMTFFRQNIPGKGVEGETVETLRVVDFEKDQGKPMNKITTIQGENFVDFHHRLLSEYQPDAQFEICDFSEWFRKSRTFEPDLPYLRYLGLFMTDGILFCNFIADPSTEESQFAFTAEIVLPAFRKLRDMFGIAPLITPIEPIETDNEHFWCYYPEEVRRLV